MVPPIDERARVTYGPATGLGRAQFSNICGIAKVSETRSVAMDSNAWPFAEARKILKRLGGQAALNTFFDHGLRALSVIATSGSLLAARR